ncbi:MAG TPA: HPr family phosphocarrier protein [Candidatus Scybalocola faecigallinarum]|uniref:HPr family phosphocarrier protein n=1 Tax=Candidatus Scybalocola faecigallinarum TaxID=2840941 RepID=A0A9D1JQ87_9FIRM|nr:HPr family phosphocarrier protein [Candidatus Scybalocola faecigallinarum]
MEKQVVVGSSSGTYPKPISLLVQTASRFDSSIYLQKGSQTINVKNIVGVLGICLKSGDEITLYTSGRDEENALNRIEGFLSKM